MDILHKYIWWEGRMGVFAFWIKGWLPLAVVSAMVGLVAGIFGLRMIAVIWELFLVWAGLALAAKRWHDRGKSAWWMLVGLIPVIGQIWVFVETGFLPGTYGPNEYGSMPNEWGG